jgi:tRNA(His) 5'-end guanylyltransferase
MWHYEHTAPTSIFLPFTQMSDLLSKKTTLFNRKISKLKCKVNSIKSAFKERKEKKTIPKEGKEVKDGLLSQMSL